MPNPSKGERTRAVILDCASRLASEIGLDSLTIGSLAEATGMSKSGLFAHFGSREELQLAVLERTRETFAEVVFRPALAKPRGLERYRAMFELWLDWTESSDLPGGCPLLGAAMEFDDRPGPIRERVIQLQLEWIGALRRTLRGAIEEGQLPETVDIEQVLFECFGNAMAYHHHRRLLSDTRARTRALVALDHLIERHASAAAVRP
jgi:AcrR family transcriptional regulator